jgi:hypothetical protein
MPRSFVILAVWVLSICSLVVFKFYVDNVVII